MGRAIMLGNPAIPVDVRRTARARRMSLRVSRLDGQVSLTLPPRTPDKEALAFLSEKEAWLRQHLADIDEPERPGPGGQVLLRGVVWPLVAGQGRRAMLRGDAIAVPADPARTGPALQAFFKEEARRDLTAASDLHAAALGVRYARITLRDTRSRWGSCSTTGGLMYSWRLVMAPPEVLDYVALHEVAHLREMNHSARFWALVESRCPDWRDRRGWLHEHGAGLHRLQFGN